MTSCKISGSVVAPVDEGRWFNPAPMHNTGIEVSSSKTPNPRIGPVAVFRMYECALFLISNWLFCIECMK